MKIPDWLGGCLLAAFVLWSIALFVGWMSTDQKRYQAKYDRLCAEQGGTLQQDGMGYIICVRGQVLIIRVDTP